MSVSGAPVLRRGGTPIGTPFLLAILLAFAALTAAHRRGGR